MAEKLKSRKWWLTFGSLVVMLFAEQLGMELSWETIAGIVSTVTGYNIGQGYVDGQKALAKAAGTPGHLEDQARALTIKRALDTAERVAASATSTPDTDA